MNKPNVRMWAKFALSPQSGATPKYVLTDAYGWVEELKDLVGRDGYISLYLQKRREGQPSDAPAMYLQAKGSLNFTGLKDLFVDGCMSEYAWGNPPKAVTYGSKKPRMNPLVKYVADGFLFLFHYEHEIRMGVEEKPLSFEMLWLDGAGLMIPKHCKQMQMGCYNELLKKCRDEAIPYNKG